VINAVNNLKFAQTNAASGSPQIDQLKFQIRQAQQKTTVDSLNNERYARLVKTLAVSKADADNARVQYTSSKSNLDVLESNLRDLEHTLKNNVDNARIQLEIQKENDDYYTIRASDPGVVLAVNKKLGDYAKKGDAICQIGSGMAIAKLYIAEDDIHRVKIGQPVLVSLNSNKNYILKATVRKLYPSFDTNDQSFVVDARFAPNQGKMINGTQLQANIIIEEKSNALVIPSEYLVNGDYVFIKGKTDKIPVSVGIRTLDYTEIRSGLSDQDVLLLPKQMK
jgi:multidrug efflux pump subunit AcrA (membrane-fusion protein)